MATKASNIAQAARTIDASGNVDGDTVDGLDSSQFLRSDTSDTMVGKLTLQGSGSVLGLEDTSSSTSLNTGFWDGVNTRIEGVGRPLMMVNYYDPIHLAISNDPKLTVATDGFVGIGTESPRSELEVMGNVIVTGSGRLAVNTTNLDTPSWSATPNGVLKVSGTKPVMYVEDTEHTASILLGSNAGNGYLLHNTGTNRNPLYIRYTDDEVDYQAITIAKTETVINEQGAARDFRVESDTATHALFVKASDGAVGIGKANPTYALDVNGTAQVSSPSDWQLRLDGNNTSWAGMYFTDIDGGDTLYYRGLTSTFAIGGGGSAVSGKKLHVNGGTTIGANVAGETPPVNGLLIEKDLHIGATDTASTGLQVGNGTQHCYLNVLNANAAGGIKVGGLLVSDSYSYATPGRNDAYIKGTVTTTGLRVDNDAYFSNGQARLHFYRYGNALACSYHHIKTNKEWMSSSQMYSLEFTGHEYGAALPVNAQICWYSYQPSGGITNVRSTGSHTIDLYQSTDGYVVIRIYLTNGYYTAWTASQYTTQQNLSPITFTSITGSSTAQFY